MARAVNFLLYYAGWFACILGPAWGYPVTGTLLAVACIGVHLALARRRHDELVVMLWAGAIGTAADTLQIAVGVLHFPIGSVVDWLPPPWMTVLWVQFAATFHYSLRWLKGRPLTAALFGAVGGPIAFAAGSRLGVVAFHAAVWPSLLSLAIVWALVMPLLLAIASRYGGRDGTGEYALPYRRRAARVPAR